MGLVAAGGSGEAGGSSVASFPVSMHRFTRWGAWV